MFAPTSEILTRTFRISAFDPEHAEWRSGASVAVDIDGGQYLVTCRHIFRDLDVESASVKLEISASLQHMFGTPDNRRTDVRSLSGYSFVGFGSDDSDVAVLALSDSIKQLHAMHLPGEKGAAQAILGGDVGILGFPDVIPMNPDAMRLHTGGFIPAVQRGCVSYFGFGDRPTRIYLGVMNSLGFSGGPVYTSDNGRRTTLLGIVEGFRTRRNPVLANYEETGEYVLENSGIMTATDISHALDAVRENPIGPRVP